MEGNTKLINNITCSFSTGITYMVGKNGAGKSSILKLIATAVHPNKGEIFYTNLIYEKRLGVSLKELNDEDIREMIGFMPQHFTGHAEMTIERYLKYMAFHKGIPHTLVKPLLDKWLKDTNLFELKRRKLRTLSGGQRQKVGLIQALINQPRICILDEPFEGLDSKEKSFFKRIIQRLSFHSVIIISTHLLEEIEQSDNVSVLYIEEGKLCFYGGADEIEKILVILKRNNNPYN
nr:ATP-binding cassette domain-containing protein [Metabacillus lacus]